MKKILSAESVGIGHPDKVADQISDAILDAYLAHDPKAHVACETTVVHGRIILAGEISSTAKIDLEPIVRDVLQDVGYSPNTFLIENYITKQSQDIAQAVSTGGAGDQGIVIGYATDETESLMPQAAVTAHSLMELLRKLRERKELSYLGSDAKALVSVIYDDVTPTSFHSIILSTQHAPTVAPETVRKELEPLILEALPQNLITAETRLLINPGGRFSIGGPESDTGMTGRKQMVDSYGAVVRHGGGAYSGKDATKVDRSGAYLARYIAKNLVKAKLAKQCEVLLTYAIGLKDPLFLQIDTFNSSKHSPQALEQAVRKTFSLDVPGLIAMLDLERPIFRNTAYGGHFGREGMEFTWERTDRVELILRMLGKPR